MPKKKKLYVLASLDVEEEGLFRGSYPARSPSIANVALLRKLAPLWDDFRFPPTLFCAHSIFSSVKGANELAWMRDHCGAEIGAHLHHWSTPPFLDKIDEERVPERTHQMDQGLLAAKLRALLKEGASFQGAPLSSFRMGRWDLKSALFPLLIENGIRVDSSICPLRAFAGGADHFLAPADPWWVEYGNQQKLLEIPITQIPVRPELARLWYGLFKNKPGLLDRFHFFGALSANPVWHSARIMRMAARLHAERGGGVLSFFWHSSEMLPGASPNIPDQAAADALLDKIFSFCEWLHGHFDVEGITATRLPSLAREMNFPARKADLERDW